MRKQTRLLLDMYSSHKLEMVSNYFLVRTRSALGNRGQFSLTYSAPLTPPPLAKSAVGAYTSLQGGAFCLGHKLTLTTTQDGVMVLYGLLQILPWEKAPPPTT